MAADTSKVFKGIRVQFSSGNSWLDLSPSAEITLTPLRGGGTNLTAILQKGMDEKSLGILKGFQPCQQPMSVSVTTDSTATPSLVLSFKNPEEHLQFVRSLKMPTETTPKLEEDAQDSQFDRCQNMSKVLSDRHDQFYGSANGLVMGATSFPDVDFVDSNGMLVGNGVLSLLDPDPNGTSIGKYHLTFYVVEGDQVDEAALCELITPHIKAVVQTDCGSPQCGTPLSMSEDMEQSVDVKVVYGGGQKESTFTFRRPDDVPRFLSAFFIRVRLVTLAFRTATNQKCLEVKEEEWRTWEKELQSRQLSALLTRYLRNFAVILLLFWLVSAGFLYLKNPEREWDDYVVRIMSMWMDLLRGLQGGIVHLVCQRH